MFCTKTFTISHSQNTLHLTEFYTALCAVKCGSCGKITALSAEMNSNFVNILSYTIAINQAIEFPRGMYYINAPVCTIDSAGAAASSKQQYHQTAAVAEWEKNRDQEPTPITVAAASREFERRLLQLLRPQGRHQTSLMRAATS